MRTMFKKRMAAHCTFILFGIMWTIIIANMPDLARQLVSGVGLLMTAGMYAYVLRAIKPRYVQFGRDGHIL